MRETLSRMFVKGRRVRSLTGAWTTPLYGIPLLNFGPFPHGPTGPIRHLSIVFAQPEIRTIKPDVPARSIDSIPYGENHVPPETFDDRLAGGAACPLGPCQWPERVVSRPAHDRREAR